MRVAGRDHTRHDDSLHMKRIVAAESSLRYVLDNAAWFVTRLVPFSMTGNAFPPGWIP
jgi:hypothetical protein